MPDKEITEIDLSRDFDCINSEKRTYMWIKSDGFV